MLTPARMKLVHLFILEKDEPRVTRALGQLKLIHLEPAESGSEVVLRPKPGREEDLDGARQMLSRIDSALAVLKCDKEGEQVELPYLPPAEIAGKLKEIEGQVDVIRSANERLETEQRNLDGRIREIESFVGLGVPLEQLRDLSFMHFALGSLPAGVLEELPGQLADNVLLLPRGPAADKMQPVAIIAGKKSQPQVEAVLEKAGFRADKISSQLTGQVDDLVRESEQNLGRLDRERQETEQQREAAAEKLAPTLRAWRRTVDNEIRILEARGHFGYTESACLISGWVPASQVNDLTESVLAETRGSAALDILDPTRENEPPSKFQHNAFFRPFQMLVASYGFPKYREVEPTVFVTISFLLMFGFMFGDVGQGGVLVLLGLLLRWQSAKAALRDAGFVMIACGLISMVWGVLYGSYFGLEHEQISWLPQALWQPTIGADSDMLLTLKISVAAGTVLISIGLIFNIINRVRARDWSHGIFDKFGLVGAVMYWAVLWLALKALVLGDQTPPVTAVLLVVAAGVVILFVREPLLVFLERRRGHSAEGLGEAVVMAAVEILEVFISYLANTLSFLRLAAYAIGHGALMLAILKMMEVLNHQGGSVGRPAGLLVFIIGNIVIIALEGMVSAIQAVRLEFYEFFGKFFSGSGRVYEPFEVE
jgi:V/A-type H+-transporting ATPase subunit I